MNHVLLVSDQAMPNFLPLLNLEMKPDSVTLVVSERMSDRAEYLKCEIKKLGISVEDDIGIGMDTADIPRIQQRLLDWAAAHEELFSKSCLNVTGGTKPMAIAAQEVFRSSDRPVFYVDIGTDCVTWIASGEDCRECVQLTKQPTLKQYFAINGKALRAGSFQSTVQNEKWRRLCEMFACDMRKWSVPLGCLNAAAQECEQRERLEVDTHSNIGKGSWDELVTELYGNELIRQDNPRFIRFTGTAARTFCSGEWLEHYVFQTLKRLGFSRRETLMNAVISNPDNELDAVALFHNTLYVIECKTKNMRREGVADDAIYKLAQVVRNGGLRAKGVLVSCRSVRSADKLRADAYGITVIDDLSRLEELLRVVMGA